MKKLLLSVIALTLSYVAGAQVIFQVKSPSSISGLYDFTNNGDGSGWGLANLVGYSVEDTLMLVDDGSVGTNAQGHPISAEGCNPLVNDLTGKIAVIFRNTCEFGDKAVNAQNAGAVAIIIINREPGLISMSGGSTGQGANVTIPVTFISNSDGELIYQEMLNGPVVVFIGDKTGKFADDAGALTKDSRKARAYSNIAATSQNGTEFSVDLGLKVRNYGTNAQTGLTVNAKVTKNGTELFNETSQPFDIPAGDSLPFTFTTFSENTYSIGKYIVTYTINTVVTDEDLTDNVLVDEFVMHDSIFSLVLLDTVTGLPKGGGGSQPSTFTTDYEGCIVYQNTNASRLYAQGLYFSAVTNSEDSLSENEIMVNAYEITNQFTDFNDAPAAGEVTFVNLASGSYIYPVGLQDNLQGTTIYQPFDNEVHLEDDKRYMFCAKANTNKIFIGYSSKINYEFNVDNDAQPLVPVITDGSCNLAGFGADNVPAIGVYFDTQSHASISTVKSEVKLNVYPNPVKENMTISFEGNGDATVLVTDLSGKVVMNTVAKVVNGKTIVNTQSLESGMYVVNITLGNNVGNASIVKF